MSFLHLFRFFPKGLLLTYGEVVPDMSQKLKDSDDGGAEKNARKLRCNTTCDIH